MKSREFTESVIGDQVNLVIQDDVIAKGSLGGFRGGTAANLRKALFAQHLGLDREKLDEGFDNLKKDLGAGRCIIWKKAEWMTVFVQASYKESRGGWCRALPFFCSLRGRLGGWITTFGAPKHGNLRGFVWSSLAHHAQFQFGFTSCDQGAAFRQNSNLAAAGRVQTTGTECRLYQNSFRRLCATWPKLPQIFCTSGHK